MNEETGNNLDEISDHNRMSKDDSHDNFVRELQQFDFIRLISPDLNGVAMGFLVPTRYADKIANNQYEIFSPIMCMGIQNEVVKLPDYMDRKIPNGFIIPDRLTLRSLPWASDKDSRTGEILFENTWEDGTPIEAHPRRVARLQLEKLKEMGYLLYSGFEAEFSVVRNDSSHDSITPLSVTYRMQWLQKFESILKRMDRQLMEARIESLNYLTEAGISMLEAPLAPKIGIESADMAFSFRQAVKEIFDKEGLQVSFMSKPLPEEYGCGWHFNHSLRHVESDKPAMFDEKGKDHLSEVMLHWIGGLLKHLPGLTALYCPTVNCYRRMATSICVSSSANWDLHSRLMSIRVKQTNPSNTFVEMRIPSSASCPYHVLAGTVAAGMDGLQNKLIPPEQGQMEGAPKLPETLEAALDALEKDEVLVESLGKDFVNWFVIMKRETCLKTLKYVDLNDNTEKGLEKERKRYFDLI